MSILPDQATTQDQLGFEDFRAALREAITTSDPPVTIGVFGDWGAGKTSMMKMLKKDLDDAGRHRTVWFDAWKFSDQEVLSRALIVKLIHEFRGSDDNLPSDEQRQKLDQLEQDLYQTTTKDVTGSLTFDWREAAKGTLKLGISMLPVVGGSFAELSRQFSEKGVGDAKGVLDALQKSRAKVHRDRIHFLDQFQNTFSDLVVEHTTESQRLVVFIDDLDRCLPEDAMRVLETIKLYLDVPPCVYVIGVDRRVIERGIRVRYRDFHLAQPRDNAPLSADGFPISGSDYLEKLIQLPFHLPPISESDIQRFVGELYEQCPAGLREACAVGLDGNPRRVKRTINIFRMLYSVAQSRPDLKDSIVPELLAKMVVIQNRWHDDLFPKIRQTPEVLQVLEDHVNRKQKGEQTDDQEDPEAHAAQPPEYIRKFGEITPLVRLLGVGQPRFGSLTRAELDKYIFLAGTTATAEPGEKTLDRDVWDRLNSDDEALVRNACSELQQLSETQRRPYAKRFVPIVEDPKQPFEKRRLAGIALALLGDPRLDDDESVMITIPAGEFVMGTPADQVERIANEYGLDKDLISAEAPQRKVQLKEYRIDRYPVTNSQYKQFVDATEQGPPPFWEDGTYRPDQANHPVVGVTWEEADTYAKWKCKRLPTEAEWEKAARDKDGWIWPWGNDWADDRCNCSETGIGQTTPVGLFPAGNSPFGAADMSGNVWEWCADWYSDDYYKRGTKTNPKGPRSGEYRVLRGGCYADGKGVVRCSFRLRHHPVYRDDFIGFRCAQ